MKKKILISTASLLMGLTIAGCGINPETVTTTNSTTSQTTTSESTTTAQTTKTSESTTTSKETTTAKETTTTTSEAPTTTNPTTTQETTQTTSPVSTETTTAQTTTQTTNSTEAYLDSIADTTKYNLGASGYVSNKMTDYTQYENTSAYVKVSTASELLNAIKLAQNTYTASFTSFIEQNGYVVRNNVRKNETNWKSAITKGLYLKNSDGTYTKIPEDTPFDDITYTSTMTYYEDSPYSTVNFTQEMVTEGSVHVIEITNDIDLGYNHLSSEDIATGVVSNFTKQSNVSKFTMSSMYKENGISQVAVQRINNLLIYSKNGAKLTHGGFKVNYSKNVTFRNLDMDEMWQWEDTSLTSTSAVGDYDAFGWAYFKIGFSDDIWIDHCSFGKSYDGQIDISNPTANTMGTYQYAPFDYDGSCDVHISWCNFHAGSTSKDGYLYKMMEEIEEDYQSGGTNYLYYNTLRDAGASFEQILYSLAIPQKKAFLDGDSGDEYFYNLNLRLSIANCYFKNVEDRIPKVRGGVCYMYNTMVDCLEYMDYRTVMKQYASVLTSKYSKWKCGLVSQCIVCGNGGSVVAKNCVFKGIYSLLKNNDSTITNNSKMVTTTANGGYYFENCSYQQTSTSLVLTDSTKFTNASTSTLTTKNFSFRTEDGNSPFTVSEISIDYLYAYLTQENIGIGCQAKASINFLKTSY